MMKFKFARTTSKGIHVWKSDADTEVKMDNKVLKVQAAKGGKELYTLIPPTAGTILEVKDANMQAFVGEDGTPSTFHFWHVS